MAVKHRRKIYPFLLKDFMFLVLLFRSGALSYKMLLVRIDEDNKIDAYFRAG